jgi:hypothetical protein
MRARACSVPFRYPRPTGAVQVQPNKMLQPARHEMAAGIVDLLTC